MKNISLVIISVLISILANAQYLGKSYKEIIDIIIKDKNIINYNIKNSGNNSEIDISVKGNSIIESSIIIQDDKCIEYRRVFKNDMLEAYLNTLKSGYKLIGEDKLQDINSKTEYWRIIQHKSNFELVQYTD